MSDMVEPGSPGTGWEYAERQDRVRRCIGIGRLIGHRFQNEQCKRCGMPYRGWSGS